MQREGIYKTAHLLYQIPNRLYLRHQRWGISAAAKNGRACCHGFRQSGAAGTTVPVFNYPFGATYLP